MTPDELVRYRTAIDLCRRAVAADADPDVTPTVAGGFLGQLVDLLAGAELARVAAVRELHHEVDEHGDGSDTWCAVCLSGEWPCETIRALDAIHWPIAERFI